MNLLKIITFILPPDILSVIFGKLISSCFTVSTILFHTLSLHYVSLGEM